MTKKKNREDLKVPLNVRVTKFQKEWLEVHELATGNKVADVVRSLIDFYIALDAEDDNK